MNTGRLEPTERSALILLHRMKMVGRVAEVTGADAGWIAERFDQELPDLYVVAEAIHRNQVERERREHRR